ncbi:MAG TPA: type II toxin-antitoxin system RelE/ParE family toxin [Candidatus Saccharimonadales bacterium]|nr:type II toxin-antitoxin system RelE/ParE family toxin [Candidatus Saccharimonadales bacterium]
MAKAKVVWRERALKDIDRLYDFIFEKNDEAAAKAARVILRGSTLLGESPRLGRPMADGTGRRELFLPFGSGFYVLRYFLIDNTVVIIRVWHGREDRKED